MRIVIAGCGWLGTEVGRALVTRGHEVIGVRRSDDPALERAGIVTWRANLLDPAFPGGDAPPADAILACQSAGDRSPAGYRAAYVEINRRLAGWAAVTGIPRLVYTGSTGVFGGGDGRSVDEASPPRPLGSRGHVLLDAERHVLAARERGVAYLEKLIRQTGSDPAVGGDRFKRADDVAAVLICAG